MGYLECQTYLHRNELLIGSEDDRVAHFFAELVAIDLAVETGRLASFGMCVFSADGVHLHVGAIRRHEFFVDIRAILANAILGRVHATTTADLNEGERVYAIDRLADELECVRCQAG